MNDKNIDGVYLEPIGNHNTDPFLEIDNQCKMNSIGDERIFNKSIEEWVHGNITYEDLKKAYRWYKREPNMKDMWEELFKMIRKNKWAW